MGNSIKDSTTKTKGHNELLYTLCYLLRLSDGKAQKHRKNHKKPLEFIKKVEKDDRQPLIKYWHNLITSISVQPQPHPPYCIRK